MSIYELERNGDVQALAEMLMTAESASVRYQAAQALGDLDTPEDGSTGEYEQMFSALRSAAIEDDDSRVRATAVSGLEGHGIDQLKRLISDLGGRPTDQIGVKTYVRLLKSERPEIRMVGLAAIGLEGTPAIGNPVIMAIQDTDPRVRERAIYTASNLGLSRAEPTLISALSDEVVAVRAAAATAIGELNLTNGIDPLVNATDDEEDTVRLAALDSLAGLGSPAAIDPLAEALGSSVASVNRLAVYGLLELLANASGSGSHMIRERVEHVASDVQGRVVIDTLIDLLEQISGTPQRRNAVWLLGQLIDRQPAEAEVEALIEHVGDEDEQTAKLATSALVRCEGPVVERIARLKLESLGPDARATGQLAYLLGRVGSDRSIDSLEATLDGTNDETVRKRVVGALNRLEASRGVTG